MKNLQMMYCSVSCVIEFLQGRSKFRLWNFIFGHPNLLIFEIDEVMGLRSSQKWHSEFWNLETILGNTVFTKHNFSLWSTLDSGINVPPGIIVAPPLKNFHITILILFYINLGIAVIFKFFLSSKFFKN